MKFTSMCFAAAVRCLRAAMLACLCVLASACTHVNPWEMQFLSRQEMAFDPDPAEGHLKMYMHHCNEATASGSAITGGGSGCS